jgi:hypothetical protein
VPIPKLTDRQKSILLVALLATLGIVLAINWASKRVADLYGPSVLAQSTDGHVWLLLNHELHVLDRHGTSLRRTPVRTLGISPPIAALAPAPDGAMIVGSRETGSCISSTRAERYAPLWIPPPPAAGDCSGPSISFPCPRPRIC